MSLRVFHIVFISASILLSLFVGVWGVREFAFSDSVTGLVIAVLFFVCGSSLVIYATKTFAKLKELS